ncbi:tetratricopeptide repeat protein [Streptomyces sp. NPDC049040]|uniref:tetratricopeptide repeat protein n=1 Tax=Streptomyces sp. NPDC049040 TaxID=3365593 RepID=UPI003723F1F9
MIAEGGSFAVGGDANLTAAAPGSVVVGYAPQVNVYGAPPAPVSWPCTVGVVPPLAGEFQVRAERSWLRDAAPGGGTAVPCQVLVGMGGVGKTQLAANYVEEAWAGGAGAAGGGVDLLVWVTASSRDAIVAEFARAGARVCGADPSDPQQAARDFLAWLRSGGRPWLVVLDNVTNPADMSGLWPPAIAHGRTLVTTRRRDNALLRGRHALDIGVFTSVEAAAYLASVLTAGECDEPPGALTGLVEDLGCLPLALSQAAAYILDASITVGQYRDLLARQARSLGEISPDVLPDDQTRTMAAAWELSVDYADRLRPTGLARPMLQLTAFLAPESTPVRVLTSPVALGYLTSHRVASVDAGAAAEPGEPITPRDAAGALHALHRLSLLSAPSPSSLREGGGTGAAEDADHAVWDGSVVRMHQVVQRATRDTLDRERFHSTARTAGDALMAVWPAIERDTGLAHALRACTTALATATEEGAQHAGCLFQPDVHMVLARFGISLGESGQFAAAAEHFQRLAGAAAGRLGADHPSTLFAHHNLAWWQGEAGDVAGAVAAFAALLADRKRVLGPHHLHTFATRGNLCRWRGQAGDTAGAAQACAELLDEMLRELGPGHSYVLLARHDLAELRGKTGDAAGAASEFAELLEDMEEVLGPNHPYTLTARHSLAGWQGEVQEPADTAAALAELLEHRTRALGPDHPDTLITRNDLGFWLGEAGRAADAAAVLAQLQEDQVRVLGTDHPAILKTARHLAYWQERTVGNEA